MTRRLSMHVAYADVTWTPWSTRRGRSHSSVPCARVPRTSHRRHRGDGGRVKLKRTKLNERSAVAYVGSAAHAQLWWAHRPHRRETRSICRETQGCRRALRAAGLREKLLLLWFHLGSLALCLPRTALYFICARFGGGGFSQTKVLAQTVLVSCPACVFNSCVLGV